jgi:hypothetical protein
MLNPFTSPLQKAIAYGALAVCVVLAGLLFALWLWLQHVEASLETCSRERAELAGRIDLQNQELDRQKKATDEVLKAGAEALKKARQVSASTATRSDALAGRILAGAGKSCDDAIRELRGAK